MTLLLPLLLLGIPIAEIAVFILVGDQIGLFPTLAMIFVTAVIGTGLLRYQGFSTLSRIRKATHQGQLPGRDMVHGVMIMAAGLLLLTPGFVTDTIGFLLFVPPIRDGIWAFLKTRIQVSTLGGAHAFHEGQGFSGSPNDFDGPFGPAGHHHSPPRYSAEDIVDLDESEFQRKDGQKPGDSPWHTDETPRKLD